MDIVAVVVSWLFGAIACGSEIHLSGTEGAHACATQPDPMSLDVGRLAGQNVRV